MEMIYELLIHCVCSGLVKLHWNPVQVRIGGRAVLQEFVQNSKSVHVNGYNEITRLFEMARNTPA